MCSARRFVSVAAFRDLEQEFPANMSKQLNNIEALLGVADATARDIAMLTSSEPVVNESSLNRG